MKVIHFFSVFFLFITSVAAFASQPIRSLPTAQTPLYVKKIFTSPIGEIQFLESLQKQTIFLRTPKGAVCEIEEIHGPWSCQDFAEVLDSDLQDIHCTFFFGRNKKCDLHVFSHEMKERSLFSLVQSIHGLFIGEEKLAF